MKRLSLILILSLLLLLACTAPVSAAGATEIATAADLAKIAENPGGSYVLVKDIDLSGIDWTPFAFKGTLDGAGHTIRGLTVRKTGAETCVTVDGNAKEYKTMLAGLFSALEGATVKDLALTGVDVSIWSTMTDATGNPSGDNIIGIYAGALAGYAADSTLLRCKITGTVSLKTNAKANGVGGAIGFAKASSVDFCRVNTTLVLTDTDKTVRDENFLGGVYAAGYAHITDSRVSLDAYDSCHGYVHSGGLVGMYYPFG
ncbi:MAG: hypothetical protein IKX91_05300, partial [Firmicutes bacterium]|nr:hypothetical protein [Bacillota bacterium]